MNLEGEVVGVNSAILANAEGIGFAIPVDHVKSILPILKRSGTVPHSFLGIQMGYARSSYGIAQGALVASVLPNTPAENAGLKPGDIIIEFNKQKISSPETLHLIIRNTPSGKKVSIEVIRQQEKKTLYVILRSNSEKIKKNSSPYKTKGLPSSKSFSKKLKISLEAKKQRRKIFLQVLSVQKDGLGRRIGIQKGDEIFSVNEKMLERASDLDSLLKRGQNNIQIKRQGYNLIFYVRL